MQVVKWQIFILCVKQYELWNMNNNIILLTKKYSKYKMLHINKYHKYKKIIYYIVTD